MILQLFSVRKIKELDLEFFWTYVILTEKNLVTIIVMTRLFSAKKKRTASVFTVFGGKNPKLRGLGGRGGGNE